MSEAVQITLIICSTLLCIVWLGFYYGGDDNE